MTKRLPIAIAALALSGFGLAACGGDDSSSSTSPAVGSTVSSTTSSADPSAGSSSGDSSTVAISADPSGAFAFTSTDLTAAAGKDTIEFTNDSSTPHNVYVEDSTGNVVAETDTIAGDTATATADLKAGTYTFYCDIPGHREGGMEGSITVK